MIFYKLIYHFNAFLSILFMRLFYFIGGGSLKIGRNVTFRKGFSVMIDKKGSLIIGDNVFFNNYCSLNANNSIEIGEGTLFGENVRVYDHNHRYMNINIPIKDQGFSSSPVTIGKHCWIASNVTILKGVHIGDNCVIGAGCVIFKDVPKNTVVVNKQNLEYRNLI